MSTIYLKFLVLLLIFITLLITNRDKVFCAMQRNTTAVDLSTKKFFNIRVSMLVNCRGNKEVKILSYEEYPCVIISGDCVQFRLNKPIHVFKAKITPYSFFQNGGEIYMVDTKGNLYECTQQNSNIPVQAITFQWYRGYIKWCETTLYFDDIYIPSTTTTTTKAPTTTEMPTKEIESRLWSKIDVYNLTSCMGQKEIKIISHEDYPCVVLSKGCARYKYKKEVEIRGIKVVPKSFFKEGGRISLIDQKGRVETCTPQKCEFTADTIIFEWNKDYFKWCTFTVYYDFDLPKKTETPWRRASMRIDVKSKHSKRISLEMTDKCGRKNKSRIVLYEEFPCVSLSGECMQYTFNQTVYVQNVVIEPKTFFKEGGHVRMIDQYDYINKCWQERCYFPVKTIQFIWKVEMLTWCEAVVYFNYIPARGIEKDEEQSKEAENLFIIVPIVLGILFVPFMILDHRRRNPEPRQGVIPRQSQ